MLTGRLARWKILLQGYPYEVDYRPGVDNVVRDALSRHPLPPECEPPYGKSRQYLARLGGVLAPTRNEALELLNEDLFYDESPERFAIGSGGA